MYSSSGLVFSIFSISVSELLTPIMDLMFPCGTVCTPSSAFFVAFEARNILSCWAGWILKFRLAAVLPSVQ